MAEKDDQPREYTVLINGLEHTMMLTAEDAKGYGDNATPKAKAKPASGKSRTPENK